MKQGIGRDQQEKIQHAERKISFLQGGQPKHKNAKRGQCLDRPPRIERIRPRQTPQKVEEDRRKRRVLESFVRDLFGENSLPHAVEDLVKITEKPVAMVYGAHKVCQGLPMHGKVNENYNDDAQSQGGFTNGVITHDQNLTLLIIWMATDPPFTYLMSTLLIFGPHKER